MTVISIMPRGAPGNEETVLHYPAPLVRATFLAREKRFTVHARLADGREVAAHTNNTGRMRGCLAPGCGLWLSAAANPARKLPWTLELVETVAAGPAETPVVLVGVNTARANELAAEAVAAGLVSGLDPAHTMRREVPYGSRGSRADLLLTAADGGRSWVEVKNVTLVADGHARFPDAPTARGRKHLEELADAARGGERAALLFCVQRADTVSVGPADDVDPEYGILLRAAAATGVILRAVRMDVTPQGIAPGRALPVIL